MRPTASLPALVLLVALCAVAAGCGAIGGGGEAACAGPMLEAPPGRAAPGEAFLLRGEAFGVGCEDAGPVLDPSEPASNVRLVFRQGPREWELETVDAGGNLAFEERVRVPEDAEPGRATVVAEGPVPSTNDVLFLVVGKPMGGEEDPETASSPGGHEAAPGVARGTFFPRHGYSAYPSALVGGVLVTDGKGCIRLEGEPGTRPATILWPPDYSAEPEGGEIRVLDAEGRVEARVGDEVRMEGGYIGPSLEGIGGVDERTRRQTHERCPGPYVYVGDVVQHASREG